MPVMRWLELVNDTFSDRFCCVPVCGLSLKYVQLVLWKIGFGVD
jgi:hypothetical protein